MTTEERDDDGDADNYDFSFFFITHWICGVDIYLYK